MTPCSHCFIAKDLTPCRECGRGMCSGCLRFGGLCGICYDNLRMSRWAAPIFICRRKEPRYEV